MMAPGKPRFPLSPLLTLHRLQTKGGGFRGEPWFPSLSIKYQA